MRTFLLVENESIVIGNGIVLRVLAVDGDEVRLEIDHPEGASVDLSQEDQLLLQAAE